MKTPFAKNMELWQPAIALKYKFIEHVGLFKNSPQELAIPFFSDKIFVDKESAALFFPKFIKDLIAEGSLPSDVINQNNELNEDVVQPFIRQVAIIAIEQEKLTYDSRDEMKN